MTATASNGEKLRELDNDTRNAWKAYSEGLRGLTGEQYEQTEHESWATLQTELRRLERRRQTLNQTST